MRNPRRVFNGVPVHASDKVTPGWVRFCFSGVGSSSLKMPSETKFDYQRMEEMFWFVQKNQATVERIEMHVDVYLDWVRLMGA